jgi:hypothetical protein
VRQRKYEGQTKPLYGLYWYLAILKRLSVSAAVLQLASNFLPCHYNTRISQKTRVKLCPSVVAVSLRYEVMVLSHFLRPLHSGDSCREWYQRNNAKWDVNRGLNVSVEASKSQKVTQIHQPLIQ